MAVAMEVAWRGAELGNSPVVLEMSKKRTWGADTEKLMQLMMGQFGSSSSPAVGGGDVKQEVDVTLDLLGTAAGSSPASGTELDCHSSAEFLELDPDQPLPSGWEKCLDLKTGELYFLNKSTGVRTSEDPRKVQQTVIVMMTPAAADVVPAASPLAHEFLGSKRSETLREESLRTSTSSTSSGGASPRESRPVGQQLLSFSTGKQLWNLQLDDRSILSLNKTGSPGAQPLALPNSSDEEESNLELNLNLAAGGNSPRSQQRTQQQSVCTMEMVEMALKRTEKAMGKRVMRTTTGFGSKHSGSSSFSSLTSSRSESWSHSSPSTSSSSSTSSRSGHQSASHHDDSQVLRVCEVESQKSETLVMGGCTRCLMYVMLNKSDPKCPRCESEVPLDFSSPSSSSKRQRVETPTIQTS
uniref:WW domain-containing protein n=1 Tax=Physcomitrium patens TaxID=3218 RepID=A0A7I4F6D6_PHYPA